MVEPLKGGQQFFSNYLREFKNTVDKLTELVNLTEQIVPKYAVASDNIKAEEYWDNISLTVSTKKQFISYLNGEIRIIFHATTSASITLQRNGITFAEVGIEPYPAETPIDIKVNEGDVITYYGGSATPKYNKIEIRYDLINKPTIAL